MKHLLLSTHLEKVMQTTSKSEGELSKVWCEKMNWRNLAVNLLSTCGTDLVRGNPNTLKESLLWAAVES